MRKGFPKIMAWALTVAMLTGLMPNAAFAGGETVAFGDIIAFAPLAAGVAEQTVTVGQGVLNLPAELTATVRFTPPAATTSPPALTLEPLEMEMSVPVTWDCPDFDGYAPGLYTFTAAVGGGFALFAAPPVIAVTVEDEAKAPAPAAPAAIIITAFNPEPYSNPDDPDTHYAVVDKGTAAADIPLPSSLAATVDGGMENAYTVAVSTWVCGQKYDSVTWQLVTGGYDPYTAGIYVFSPVLALNENEILADGVIPPAVEVVVTENMAITPLANSYTWDVSTTNTFNAADGDVITLIGTLGGGNPTLDVPANVTVTINGTINGANTNGLRLQIGANATVIWNASLTVSEHVAVRILQNSQGEFIMESGLISCTNGTPIFYDLYNCITDITINGGTVTSGTTDVGDAAIYQPNGCTGTITVKTGGKVEATNGSYAIYGRGHVIIDGGTVRSKNNDAIWTANHNVTVNSGTVEVTGTGNAIYIFVESSNTTGGNVIVNNSTVSADAGDAIHVRNSSSINLYYFPELNINGGTVSSKTGNAIFTSRVNVTVKDSKVLATTGHAIWDDMNSGITVEDALVFAYGSAVVGGPLIGTDNVVYKGSGTFTAYYNVPPNGVVIAWNQAAGNTTYTDGSTTDIKLLSNSGVTAYWAKDGGSTPGIYYARGTNTGFIPLPVTVSTAVNLGTQTVSITAPVSGASPQLTVADGTGYVGTGISWNGNPAAFAPSAVYTATVTLTSTNGYKWPVTPPTITVSGGTVSNRVVSGGDVAGNELTFTVTFPATADAPGAPTGLTATPGDKEVTLAWTAPASVGAGGITGYEYTYTYTYTSGSVVITSPWTSTGNTSTTFTVTGLTNGRAYNFQVRAVNTAGKSIASNTAAATPRMVPYAPTNLSATAGDGQVTLSWTEPTNGGSPIIRYEYTTNDGSTWTSTGGTSTSFIVTGLTNGITYSFLVRAVNAAGAGPDSNQADAMPVDTTVPVLSLGSVNRASHAAATIDFTTNRAGEAYYLVLDKDDPAPTTGAEVVSNGTPLGTVSAGAVTDLPVTLTAGDKDIYVVVVNNVGASYALKISADAFNSLSQAIVFNTTQTTAIYGDSFTHTAALDGAGGAGAVTYAVTNGPATVDSDTGEVTVTGVGSVTVTATKAADDYYDPAAVSYSFTANPKTLTVTGVTAANREYNGMTTVAVTGGTLQGVVSGDTVSPVVPATGTIADANAGNNKAVNIGTITLSGAKAGNYTLTQPTGITVTITPATLTPSISFTGVSGKTYDGTTAISGTQPTITLTGAVYGETPAATAAFAFADANAGNNKNVTASNITLGAWGTNYTLSVTTLTAAANGVDIIKAAPSVTWPNGLTATYGQTLANVSISGGSSTPAGSFTWTTAADSVGSVGSNPHGMTFTPADAVNYDSAAQAVSINVSAAPITGTVTIDPTIAGTILAANDTLTANVSGVSQAGTADPLSYEWFRNGTPAGAASAANNTYTVTAADETAQAVITVKVSGTINHTGTLESAPVIVGKAPLGGSISISGGLTAGSVLSLVKTSLTPSGAAHTTKWLRDGTAISNENGDSYRLSAADLGKTITVEITGSGSYTGSLSASVDIPAVAPAAPQNFTATAGNGQVTLAWAAPASDGGAVITRYQVSGDNGAAWTTAASNTGHTFTGLANGTSYTFKVRAVNSAGSGAEASATATPSGGGDNTGGGNNTGGGGNAGGTVSRTGGPVRAEDGQTPPATNPTVPVNDDAARVDYTEENGTVTLDLTGDKIREIIGKEIDKTASFDLTGIDEAATAVLDVNAARAFSGAEITLTLKLPDAAVTLAPDALAALAATTDDGKTPITVEAAAVPLQNLTDMQAAQVKGYETVINVDVFVGSDKVDVPVTISLPYVLRPGQDPNAVCVWHLDDSGELTKINGAYDADAGVFTFTVGHQSLFVVGYDPVTLWLNVFSDVAAGAWYYDAVAYSNYYGLFSGYGGGIYAPNDSMTRAMFVTVLWNMEGCPGRMGEQDAERPTSPVPSGAGRFNDVTPGAWEHDAVQWAYESGILNGIISGAGGSFAPGRAVTRQEMAVMLFNYANYKGYDIPENRPLPGFKDFGQIDIWAETAARKLSEAGVFDGDNGEFMPHKTASRAEVAQMFKNFLRFVVGNR